MNRRIAGAALAVTVALVACGGGGDGGGGDGPLQVTFSPASIVLPTWDDWFGRHATVTATLSPLPSGGVYVYVLDSAATFSPGALSVYPVPGSSSSFWTNVPVKDGLAPGDYLGTLTLKICKDAGCTQPYALSRSTVPYDVTVMHAIAGTTPATAQVKIDGSDVAASEALVGDVRTYTVTMQTGHTVQLLPSSPFLTRSVYDMSQTSVAILAPGPSGDLRATVAFSSGVPTTGFAKFEARSDGGGTVHLVVNLVR